MNVGTGLPVATLELAQHISGICGRELHTVFGPPRAGDIQRSVLDNTRFERALGSTVPLGEGLRHTFAWYRASK
jgi:nucleoside-diphosphate-sugar epimerase